MPTFVAPTYEQPIGNRLGDFGVAFPVAYTVVIASGVVTSLPGATGLVDPDQLSSVADAGSGDDDLAIFTGGRSYTINGTEDTLLTAAGYTTSP